MISASKRVYKTLVVSGGRERSDASEFQQEETEGTEGFEFSVASVISC